MELIVDEQNLGRSESEWSESGNQLSLTALNINARRVIVVAPHPDDEVLGAGGLIQAALAGGIDVQIVAVTDGEGSHPQSTAVQRGRFREIRAGETRAALRKLGWEDPHITRLSIPDGEVARQRDRLSDVLGEMVRADDLCVAPWRSDGHPDHDACGESALEVSRGAGATEIGYLIWAWHWADPSGSDIPWHNCRRLDLSRREGARKRWSTAAFHSQTHPLGPEPEDAPVLPAAIMRRFWRRYEVYVDEMAVVQ